MTKTEQTRAIKESLSRDQNEALLKIQHHILEQLVLGKKHQSILDALCIYAEKLTPNSSASIMLFDQELKSLQVVAAPSIPDEAIKLLNGLIPGPNAGSCGTAVYSALPQYVCNTQVDARWANFRRYAVQFNIAACWSNPIRINDELPVGSFALSSSASGEPSEFHKRLLETCAYIAGIVIKRQQEEDQLWKLAHYDTLTGLPNRSFFTTHLEYTIRIAKGTQSQFALLFLDIDKFKDINDTQGHEAGDQVLKYIAERIQSCLRKGDTFARLGGDEFTILIENINDSEQIKNVCQKICQSFKTRFKINGIDYPLSASIGISIFPQHGDTAAMLLRNADTAMYEAKKNQSHEGFYFYREELTNLVTERLQLTAEIRDAIRQQQFIVQYQPQYCLKSGKIIGAEALVRWQHPIKGLIPPSDFIPIAEHSELINDLGIYVLTEACQQTLAWWSQGLPTFTLAVNLSVNQLHPGFADSIANQLNKFNFPLQQLELEVTESLIMKYDDLSELEALEKLGIAIAMDDFGTGHSSLAQLKKLPISKLKIDQSFIKDIPDNSNDMIIASTIISMGLSLNLKVVAEGVETEEQKAFLTEKGCHLLQGYLLSKPLPADEFETLLKQSQ
jgi:diguanylate cyclase (GGDEF)-like protein